MSPSPASEAVTPLRRASLPSLMLIAMLSESIVITGPVESFATFSLAIYPPKRIADSMNTIMLTIFSFFTDPILQCPVYRYSL